MIERKLIDRLYEGKGCLMKIIFSLIISLMILNAESLGEDLREDTRYSENDPKAYTMYDLKHNIDVIKKATEKIGTRRLDNNIWVYTEEFAKRFGMPKRWIGEEDFKGALAIAYRQEIYAIKECGYFQSWENCREFREMDVLDIYVPHNLETIPWNTDKLYGTNFVADFNSSKYWLKPYHFKEGKSAEIYNLDRNVVEHNKDKLTEQSYKDLISYIGFESVEPGIDSIVYAHRFKSDGFGEGGGGWVHSFHRNIFDGIDLITIHGMSGFSTSGDGEMQIWLDSMKDYETKKAQLIKKYPDIIAKNGSFKKSPNHKTDFPTDHKIYPGKSFMERMKKYKEEHKENSFFEYFKKNINNNKN